MTNSITMTTAFSYNLLSSVANWNQTSLNTAFHPLEKLRINTLTLVSYIGIALISLIELVVRVIFDLFISLWRCEVSLTNSKLSINACHKNGMLIYQLFKNGISRLADLQ